MKRIILIAVFALVFSGASLAQKMARVTPESEGISSTAIINFLDGIKAGKNEFHSFVLLRHGNIVAEGWWNPYALQMRHTLYSTSKSFTSTAVGFAVSEGKLKLSDKVVSFFPQDLPLKISPLLAQLTVQNLITMSAGQRPEPHLDENSKDTWVKQFLAAPIVDTPGTKFLYNSIATYMLSAIVQKVSGQKVLDYLQPRLFTPLGISGADWEESPQGINTGGWGLRLKTEDMAKFGQMLLQKGKWQGKTVVPQNWVEEATTFKIKNWADTAQASRKTSDWAQGYCYQFWRCRYNAFRADGAFGQYIVVMPDQDAVIAITCETGNMQNELNLVWEHLLPAMKSAPLPGNKTTYAQLQARLKALEIAMPEKTTAKGAEAMISGKSFKVDTNQHKISEVKFTFNGDQCRYDIDIAGQHFGFTAGRNARVAGETSFPFSPPSLTASKFGRPKDAQAQKTSASFRWVSPTSMEIYVRYPESAHSETFI
ncbi:MAG: serine hydrolase, partial [Mucilaginibacter polytrichastri]|nr:serine hydrolase [Mucilaginibacter polytrichastri]